MSKIRGSSSSELDTGEHMKMLNRPEFEKEKNQLLAFAVFFMQYRDAYNELSRLLPIACTLPVTSAEAEPSF